MRNKVRYEGIRKTRYQKELAELKGNTVKAPPECVRYTFLAHNPDQDHSQYLNDCTLCKDLTFPKFLENPTTTFSLIQRKKLDC